jgi:hypothetical protein
MTFPPPTVQGPEINVTILGTIGEHSTILRAVFKAAPMALSGL